MSVSRKRNTQGCIHRTTINTQKEGSAQRELDMYTIHLFAGAGGGILADSMLGHTPIGACEIEAYPRQVLIQRQLDGILPAFPVWDDIATLSQENPECAEAFTAWKGVREELAICGGFP